MSIFFVDRLAQSILIVPGLAADAFFAELAGVMRNRTPVKAALDRFGAERRVQF
jgi:hypothetical protein